MFNQQQDINHFWLQVHPSIYVCEFSLWSSMCLYWYHFTLLHVFLVRNIKFSSLGIIEKTSVISEELAIGSALSSVHNVNRNQG